MFGLVVLKSCRKKSCHKILKCNYLGNYIFLFFMFVKVIGPYVQVEKEKIDAGALRLTPGLEEDGQKNTGKIIGIGQVGLRARLRGIKKGKTIHFRKFFIANDGQQDACVFVNVDDILGIINP